MRINVNIDDGPAQAENYIKETNRGNYITIHPGSRSVKPIPMLSKLLNTLPKANMEDLDLLPNTQI